MSENTDYKLSALVDRVRKVRSWLVSLAILKIAALCLIFVSVYIGIYAWLDHRLHFGEFSRIIAFILLVSGIVFLLYRLTKVLFDHISCSRAANYIESRKSFEQQLVTAIEYYENKNDYPYSRSLAEHLVAKIDRDCKDYRFDSAVPKWQGYVFAGIIIFGLSMVVFYTHDNFIFFSSYFRRLVQPLAAVEPLPATSLESVTGDIVAEPDSILILAAGIKGRMPESGKLVLTGTDPNDLIEESQLFPSYEEGQEPKFEAARTFAKPTKLRYRFESDSAVSPWHDITICEIPKIKDIIASISLGNNKYVKPYTQQVKNNTLEVARNSFVALNIKTTEKLSKVVVRNLDGKFITKQLNDVNEFDFNFVADVGGLVEFTLTSTKEITNDNMPALQIVMKIDEPARFKLVSPSGDYMATNVASVPLKFEITDDFGLDSASMYLEINGRPPQPMIFPIKKGAKKANLTYTLELEKHDLTMGDSILFYAKAKDVDTGLSLKKNISGSDIYFIEVRPYRRRWHQIKPRLPDQAKQGLKSDKRLEFLITILEYTRAILKKTWVIANDQDLSNQDRSKLDSIDNDVQYCAEQLEARLGKFDDEGKATLNEIISYYNQASEFLAMHNASSAIAPEKDAYRILRKFINELDKAIPPKGAGSPPKTRDKIELVEQVHLARYEKERIEWELKKLEQKLAELAAEQKKLKKEFEKFLKQQEKEKALKQETTDEKSWYVKDQQPDANKPKRPGTKPGSADNSSNVTVDGALKPPPKAQAQGKGKGQGKGQGQTSGKKDTASVEDRMKMFQARQRALQQQISELKKALEQLPQISEANGKDKREQAQEHLDKAMSKMNEFQAKLSEAFYKAKPDKSTLKEAVAVLDSTNKELEFARAAIKSEFNKGQGQLLAKGAAQMAEKLADLADALDESLSDSEREDMLAQLEEAKSLLEMLPKGSWMPKGEEEAVSAENSNQKGQGGTGTGSGDGKTESPGERNTDGKTAQGSSEMARLMARQFFSISINAKKRQSQLIEEEPSDAKFYELESRFFENAAKFNQGQTQK